MFKTIFSLATEGIARKKRQSLLIFFVLLISFTFAIILLSYTSSVAETNSQLRLDTFGSWYGAIDEGIDSDLEYLESEEWVDEVGTSVNYGSASVVSGNPSIGYTSIGDLLYGTIDDSLADMGIILESGRLPKASDEIAIQSSNLTELGLSESSSSISLDFTFYSDTDEEPVTVSRTFKIVGVIKEYTGLWSVDSSLNEAIITEESVNEIRSEASEALGSEIAVSADCTYFFTVNSVSETTVLSEVNNYLWSVYEETGLRTVSINTVISLQEEEAQLNTFYVWLVLAVTLLAVVMIYILQMQSDVRRIVRFRSIGSTKGQVRLLIMVEALLLCVPAVLMGTLLGLAGIKILLGLSVYSGSVNISVSLPWNYLVTAVAVWIIGVLFVRMLTIQVALATPLTGRMGMQRKKSNFYGNFRRVLIMLMAILLSVSTIFTTINVAEPVNNYQEWTSKWSYCFYPGYRHNNVAVYLDDSILSEIASTPGVTDVVAFTNFYAFLTTADGDVQRTSVIIMDLDDVAKFLDVSDVDETAYENGETVIVQTIQDVGAITSEIGDSVTLSIDYVNDMSDYFYVFGDDTSGLINIPAVVASSQTVSSITETLPFQMEYFTVTSTSISCAGASGAMFYNDYIICSRSLLQSILNEIPEDKRWEIDGLQFYHGQSEAEYYEALVYTNTNAENLATDTAMSNILKLTKDPTMPEFYYYRLNSQRETNYDNAKIYQQSIIMIVVSGVCIAVVVLLILVSTLRLETESEKKRYGILQAIGMSKRQRNMELIRKSIVRSIIAIVAAVAAYLAYYLIMNISAITAGESAMSVLGTMFATLVGYGLTVPVLLAILAATFLVTFAICFGTKLSLNRYTLMEMLHDE